MEMNTRGWKGVNWTNLFRLSQDRDNRGSGVKEVMKLRGAGVKEVMKLRGAGVKEVMKLRGCVKCTEFIECPKNYWLFRNSASWSYLVSSFVIMVFDMHLVPPITT